MPRSLIAIGSNLGDRAATIDRAIAALAELPRCRLTARSAYRETAPVGGSDGQPAYLNAAAALETTLAAEQLFEHLRQIEIRLGRHREAGDPRWAARTINLDVALFGEQVVHTQQLVVPHPRFGFRRFMLEPAAEIAPDMTHPTIGWTVARLLEHLNTARRYVAILGLPGRGKTALAERLSACGENALLRDPVGRILSTPTADEPSCTYNREIQLLDCRHSALADNTLVVRQGWTISDFYFDQGLAYARALGGQHWANYQERWQATRQNVIQPKLLVVLASLAAAAAVPATVVPAAHAGDADEPTQESLGNRLLRLAMRPGLGPVLFAGDEPRVQWRETSAALAAML